MKTFLKEKKKIVIGIAIAVVLIIAVICIAVCTNKDSGKNVKTPIKSETVVFTNKKGKEIKKSKKEKAKEKASKEAEKKKQKSAWDNIEVKEEGTRAKKDKEVLYKRNKKGEIVTNKKGEKITRKPKYAGEDDGWSPIVSPDDLKKDKK